MRLHRLSLVNFKNIASAAPRFSEGFNCLVGDNGAGKTNVLDALHYLSMCRSSLGTTDRQSLRHGEAFFVVEGEYVDDEGHRRNVACSFATEGEANTGKKIKCDGKEYDRFSDHVGVVPMVMVSPADTFLISDAADERRRWLNSFVSQLDRAYLQSLVRYNAVLAERNRLLKEPLSRAGVEILDVLDMQLSDHGDRIHARRAEIVDAMRPLVADYYACLSDDREEVEMTYRTEISTDRPLAEVLAAAREKDFAVGFTTAGVHRDDITMRIGGHPLRRYGSQGQQKSFLVALKLAQFSVSRDVSGETPLLLLDDLFDKLDTGRVERLIGLLDSDLFGQVFISDCNRARLEGVLQRGGRTYSLFELANGNIVENGNG
ncbi:MAG: DNA replication and repair protein RecF [Alistipes sp.]|jgi:DNA replication and repair protein RecF|nr:DNA replication and repair protein RecF [Alistipes sp.]